MCCGPCSGGRKKVEQGYREQGLVVTSEHADFDSFYLAHYRKVYRLVSCGLSSPQDVQHIVQDTFAAFFEVRAEIPKKEWLLWLYNKARDKRKIFTRGERRRAFRESVFSTELTGRTTAGPESRYEKRELIMKVLSQLPEDKAQLLELHYLSSMNQEEIAKVLGVSAVSIPKLLRRARLYFSQAYQALNQGE